MNAYKPCNLCKQSRYRKIRPYPGWDGIDLVSCESCGLMQAQPTPTNEFLWNFYQTTFGSDPVMGHAMTDKSERGFRLRATLQMDFVRKWLGGIPEGKGRKVLDVGCHAASFLSLFKRRGYEVTGVDPNPRSEYADKWYGIRVIQKLFSKDMFPSESFDGILHSHALEHVPDPKQVLEEFYRLLKPGGWAFIEVSNESIEKVSTARVIPHLYFFTPETLGRMARESGFEVLSTPTLDVGPVRAKLFSKQGFAWLKLRWQARFDAKGRTNLFTQMPLFGRVFKQDRYFGRPNPKAVMLRAFLRKPVSSQARPAARNRESTGIAG